MESLKQHIENVWTNREMLQQADTQAAIRTVIEELNRGVLRVASPEGNEWKVNEWVKKAVLLYFLI